MGKALELTLSIDRQRKIAIQGYGGAIVETIGLVEAFVKIDDLKRFVPLYVVADTYQTFDVLIGQPFTESPNTYVVKTTNTLHFCEENDMLMSYEMAEPISKFKLCTSQTAEVVPGINKIVVCANINNGTLITNYSEQDYNSWEQKIPEVQRGINVAINSSTGKSPSELLYGFRPRSKYDINIPDTNISEDRQDRLKNVRLEALGKLDKTARAMKTRYDRNRLKALQFKEGDMVMVERTPYVKGITSGKLVQRYIGPVRVMEVLSNDRYRVQSLSKDRRRFKGVIASDKMKLYKVQITK